MPATDAATLLSSQSVACYNNYSAQQALLKLALLQIIAKALNPMAATDPQSLLSTVACYNCNYSWPLLELALLQIIANNTGAGGGAADYINYAGPPTSNPPAIQNIVVDVNGVQWQFFNNQWN